MKGLLRCDVTRVSHAINFDKEIRQSGVETFGQINLLRDDDRRQYTVLRRVTKRPIITSETGSKYTRELRDNPAGDPITFINCHGRRDDVYTHGSENGTFSRSRK